MDSITQKYLENLEKIRELEYKIIKLEAEVAAAEYILKNIKEGR